MYKPPPLLMEIGRVHGQHHTYTVKEDTGLFSTKYYIARDEGKSFGSYSSRAAAFRAAHEKAGRGSYEVKS